MPSNTPSGKVVNWLMLNSSRCSPVRPEKSPARKAVNCFDSRSRLSTPASAWESTAAQSSASSAVKMASLTCSVRSHMLTVCAWAGSAAAANKRASSVLIRFILGCKSIGAVAGGQRQAFGSSARGHASKRPSTALQRQPLLPITLSRRTASATVTRLRGWLWMGASWRGSRGGLDGLPVHAGGGKVGAWSSAHLRRCCGLGRGVSVEDLPRRGEGLPSAGLVYAEAGGAGLARWLWMAVCCSAHPPR